MSIVRRKTRVKNHKKALENVVKAWEVLRGGRRYSSKEIEHWLVKCMGPAIDDARDTLSKGE